MVTTFRAGTSGCEGRVLKIAKWVWQPYKCRLRAFDPVWLSRLMAGRRVHFIGDSTMRQQFWSLGRLMEAAGLVDVDTWTHTEWRTVHNATFSVQGIEFLTGDGCEFLPPNNRALSTLNMATISFANI